MYGGVTDEEMHTHSRLAAYEGFTAIQIGARVIRRTSSGWPPVMAVKAFRSGLAVVPRANSSWRVRLPPQAILS